MDKIDPPFENTHETDAKQKAKAASDTPLKRVADSLQNRQAATAAAKLKLSSGRPASVCMRPQTCFNKGCACGPAR